MLQVEPYLGLPVQATFSEVKDFIGFCRDKGATKVQLFGLGVEFPQAVMFPMGRPVAPAQAAGMGHTTPPAPTPREQRKKTEAEAQAEYEKVLFYSADGGASE